MSEKDKKDAPGSSSDANKPINDDRGSAASRARNKTVMLSPEMTGQVRAMLQDELSAGGEQPQESAEFDRGQPSPMDSLFSGQERFETRSTSVVDTDALQGYNSEPTEQDASQSDEYDPMTSLISGSPPLRSEQSYEQETFIDQSYEGEQTPSPAVEQPAFGGFSVSPQEPQVAAAPAQAPKAAGSAPRKPVSSGPKGWHAVVSTRDVRGKLVGLLVSYDREEEGELFEIRSGRFLITSRPTDNGDYLLIDDETISPLHAIVRVTENGTIQILDQLSEYGTGLCKSGSEAEDEVAGGLATIEHGDTVRFGKRYFVVVCIPAVVKRDE